MLTVPAVRVYLSLAVIIASKVGPDRAGEGPSFSGLGSDAMNAGELYKAGRLGEAIEAQVQEVRASPLDHSKRLFLFEPWSFRATLTEPGGRSTSSSTTTTISSRAVAGYRKLLDSEQARRDLFTRGVAPGFFGEPSEHLRLRLEAVNRLRENAPADGGRGIDSSTPGLAIVRRSRVRAQRTAFQRVLARRR